MGMLCAAILYSRPDAAVLRVKRSHSAAIKIVPTEVVFYRNRKTNPTWSLSDYEEKWEIFAEPPLGFTLAEIRKGFRHLAEPELAAIAQRISITGTPDRSYKFSARSQAAELPSVKDWYVLEIWRTIFAAL